MDEIVFTSAARGLQAGKTGFCTVASTPNMTASLLRFLESASGYRHLYSPGDANNPVVRAHVHAKIGGKKYHVLSRIADAGMDYSQRSNKLAHHMAIGNTDSYADGPLALMWKDQNFISEWDKEPVFLEPRSLTAEPGLPASCRAWGRVAGDAGRAGDLLEAVLKKQIVYLVVEPDAPVIELIDEAVALLPPEQRWKFTFSTFFTRMPPNVDCLVRCVFPDSPELTAARRSSKNAVIDTRIATVSTSQFAPLARSGQPIGELADSFIAEVADQRQQSQRPVPRDPGESTSQPAKANGGLGAPPTLAAKRRAYAAQTKQVAEHRWLSLQTMIAFGVGVLCASLVGLLLLILSNDSRQTAVAPAEDVNLPEKPVEAVMDEVADAVVPSIEKTKDTSEPEVVEAPVIEATGKNDGDYKPPKQKNQPKDQPEPKVAVQSVLKGGEFTRFVLKESWAEARVRPSPVKLFKTTMNLDDLSKCDFKLRSCVGGNVSGLTLKGSQEKSYQWDLFEEPGEEVEGAEGEKVATLVLECNEGEKSVVGKLKVIDNLLISEEIVSTIQDSELQISHGSKVLRFPLNRVSIDPPKCKLELTPPNSKPRLFQVDGLKQNDESKYQIKLKETSFPYHNVLKSSSVATLDFTQLPAAVGSEGSVKPVDFKDIPEVRIEVEEFKSQLSVLVEVKGNTEDVDIVSAIQNRTKKAMKDEIERIREIVKSSRAAIKKFENDKVNSEDEINSEKEKIADGISKIDDLTIRLKKIKSDDSRAQLETFISKILIPVEIRDKIGRTLAVTILHFKKAGGAPSEMLENHTLEVLEGE